VLVTTPGSPPSGAVTIVPIGSRGAFTGVELWRTIRPRIADGEGVDQRDLLGGQVQDRKVDRDGDDRGDRAKRLPRGRGRCRAPRARLATGR
jgi:hypothetical protein